MMSATLSTAEVARTKRPYATTTRQWLLTHSTEVVMHALTLLKKDHKTVATLFEQFQKARATASKKAIVDKIVKELSVHTAIEEMVFYPAVREAVKDAEDAILESLEEHHIVKWVARQLERMSPTAERYDAKVKVLCENVAHHVKEEEQELFPKVRKTMTIQKLNELGVVMEAARKTVGVAIVDRVRDMRLAKTGVRRPPAKRQNHTRKRAVAVGAQ